MMLSDHRLKPRVHSYIFEFFLGSQKSISLKVKYDALRKFPQHFNNFIYSPQKSRKNISSLSAVRCQFRLIASFTNRLHQILFDEIQYMQTHWIVFYESSLVCNGSIVNRRLFQFSKKALPLPCCQHLAQHLPFARLCPSYLDKYPQI